MTSADLLPATVLKRKAVVLAAGYRDRDTRLNRVADFKLALANGDITPPEQLSKSMQAKLAALGIVL